MKYAILIFVIFLQVSCSKSKIEVKKSNFILNRDFKDFKTKMTELDTLKVGMFIGACTYHT